MATEPGILEHTSEKIEQEETGNERFDQPQISAEYVKELLELSHESEIKGDLEPVSLQKLQVPTDWHSIGSAAAAHNSSEIFHNVILETIDNSESANFPEEILKVQSLSERNCKDCDADVLAEIHREELREMSETTITPLNDEEDGFYNERNETMEEVQSKEAEHKNQMASDSPAYVLEDTDPENKLICDLPVKVHQDPNAGKRVVGDREEYERITANEDTEEKKSDKEKIKCQPMIEIQELKFPECSQKEPEALSSPDVMKGSEEELITSEENKEKLEAKLVEEAALQNCELINEYLQDDTYLENNEGNRLDNGKFTEKEILSQDVIKTSDIDEKQQPESASAFIEERLGEEEKLEESPNVASGNPGPETQISIEEQEKTTEKEKASAPTSVDEPPPLPLSVEKSHQDNGESANDQIAVDDARENIAISSPRDTIDNVPEEIILDKEREWQKVDRENEAQKEEKTDTENSDALPTTIEDEIQPPNEAKESEDINKRTSEVVAEENIQHKSTEEESLVPSSNECGHGLFDDASTIQFSTDVRSACEEDHNQEEVLDEMKVQIMNCTVLEVSEPHIEDHLKQIEAKSDIDNQKFEVFDNSQTESISDIEASHHMSFNKDVDDLPVHYADEENLQAPDKHVDKTIYREALQPEPKSAETVEEKHESLYEPMANELETTEEDPNIEKESMEDIELVKHVEESSKEEEKEPHNNDVDTVESMSGQQHVENTNTTFETEDGTHTAVKVEGDSTTGTEVIEVLDQEKDLDEMKVQIMNCTVLEASEPHIEDCLKQIEAKSDIDNQKFEVFDDSQRESISDIEATHHVSFNKKDADDLPVEYADRENLQAPDKHVDKTIYGEAFEPEPKSAETVEEKHESLYEPVEKELETTKEDPNIEKESMENIELVKHVEESSKEEEKEPLNTYVGRVASMPGQQHVEITDTTVETEHGTHTTHTAVKVKGDLTTRTEIIEVLDQEKDLDEMKVQIMNCTVLEASEPHIKDHLKQIEAKSDIDNQKLEVFDDSQTESISDIEASCHASFNKDADDLPVDYADGENLQAPDKHVDKIIYGEAFKPEPKSAETVDEKHESLYEPMAKELETTKEDPNVQKEHADNIELVKRAEESSEKEEKEPHNNDVDRVESMLGQQHVGITDNTTVETEHGTHTAVKVKGDLTTETEVVEVEQEIIEKNWIGTDSPCESKIHDGEKYAEAKAIGASTENDSMEEVNCDASSSQVRMGARIDMGDARDNVCATAIHEKIGTPEEVAEKDIDERTDGKSIESTMLEDESNVEEKEMRTGADQIGCLKYSAEIAGEQQKSSIGEAAVEKICLVENRNMQLGTSVMQKAKWEDKPVNLTDAVPEKEIMAEERCRTEVHEMIQEQHNHEKGEVNEQVEQEVVGVYTEGPCCKQITKLEEISQSRDTDDGVEMVKLKDEDNFNNSEVASAYVTLSQDVHQMDDQNDATLKPGLEEELQETTHTEEAMLIDNKPAHKEQIEETTNTGEMVGIQEKMEADDEVEATARWNQLVPDSEPQCKSQEMTSETEADMIEQSIIEVKHHDLVKDKDNQDCNVAGIPLVANPVQVAFDEKHDKKAESKEPEYMNQNISDSAEYILEDTNPDERSIHDLPAEDPFVGKYEAGEMEENEVKEKRKSGEEILEKQQKLEATSEVQEAKFPESSQAEPKKACVSLEAAKDSEEELKTIVEEKKELEGVSLEAASIQISEQLGECLQKGTCLENKERDSVNDGIYMQNEILSQDMIKTAEIEQPHQNVLAYASIEEGLDEEEKLKESSSVASGKLVPEAQVSIEEQEMAIEKGDTFASKSVNELPVQQLSLGKSPPDIGESAEGQIASDDARDNVAMQSPRDEASVAPSVDYVPEETILNQEGEQQTDDMEHEAPKEEKTNTENSDASSTKIKDLIQSPEEAKEGENPIKGTFEIVADEDIQDKSTEEESIVPSSDKTGHEEDSATSLAKDIQSAYEEEQNHEKVLDEVKVQFLNCSTPEASEDSEPHIESHLKELEAKEIDNQGLGVLEESQTEPTTDIEASIDLNADKDAEDSSVGCTSKEYLQQAPDTSSESVEKRINDESSKHADKRINNEIIKRVDKIIDEETLHASPERAETVDEKHESLYKPEPKELETIEKDLNTEKESVENDELVKHVEGSSQEAEKEFDNYEAVTVESMPGFQHAAKTDIIIQTENDTRQRKDQSGTTLKPGLKEQIQEATNAEDSTVIDVKHAHVEQIQEITVKPEARMVDRSTDEDHVANTQIHALVDWSKETQTTKTENENEGRIVGMHKSRTESADAEIISKSIPDDQSQETNPSETKIENITNDDDVDNMLPPVIYPNRYIDTANSTIHVTDPETTHVVGETEVYFNQETTRSEKPGSTSASDAADQNQEITLDAKTFQTGTMMDADLHNNMRTGKEDLCESAENATVQTEGNLNETDVNTSSAYMLISEGALDNVGGKYEKHSNSEYEEKDQTTSTKLNVVDDAAHDQQEMPEIISEQMPENQIQHSGGETETTEIEKKTYDEMLNNRTGSLSNFECLTEDNMQKDVEERKNESSEVDGYMDKPISEDDMITTSTSSTEKTVENSMPREESRTSRSCLNQDEKKLEGINLDENIDQLTSKDEETSDQTCKPNMVAGRLDRSNYVDCKEHTTGEKAPNDINIQSEIDENGGIDAPRYKFEGSAAETSYRDQLNESNEETYPIQNADGDEKLTDSDLPSEFEREADNEPPKIALEDAQTEPTPAPDEDVNHASQNKDLGCVPENDESNLSKSAGESTLVSQLAEEAQQEKQHDVGPGFSDVKKVAEITKKEVSIDLHTLREDKVGQHEETSTLVSEDLNQKHIDEIGVTKSESTEDEAMTSETSLTEYKEEIHEIHERKEVNESKECLAIMDAKTTDGAAGESSKQPQGIMDEKQNDAYGPGIKGPPEGKVTINSQVMLEEEECVSITTANLEDDPVTVLNTTEAIEKEIAKGKMSEENVDLTNQEYPSITLDHISNNNNSEEVISQIEASTPHQQVDNIKTEEKRETITNKHEKLQEQNETSVEDSKKGTKECVEAEEYPEMIFERTETNNLNEKYEEITGKDSCAESPETGALEDEVTKEHSTEEANTAKHMEAETLSETQETHAMTNQNYEVKESDLAKSETNLVKVSEDDKVVTESSIGENSENNIIVPPSTMASAEDTVSQELGEELVRGYESEPKEYHQETDYANKRVEELATEETKCTVVATEASAGNNIDTTLGEAMAGKVAVDENERSSSKKIENDKNSGSFSAIQTTDVSILQDTSDIVDQVTEINYEVGKSDRSQGEENQQLNLNDLPVSRFLMDHILREGDMPAEVCVSETQNKIEEEDTCEKDNDASIPEEEHIVDSSTEKEATKQSTSEIKDLEKLEISPEAMHEEQRHDAKGHTEIAAKPAEATQNDVCLPPSIMAIEEVEPEVSNLVVEQSTGSVTTNCNELMPTEESTVNLVEDEKPDEAVSKLKTTERAVPNNNDNQNKDVKDLTVIGICEGNLLGGGDRREVSDDCKHINKDAHTAPQEQAPTMPHLLKSSSCLVQSAEQFPNPHCEQTENISQPSTTEATKHGESSLNEGSDIREVTSREQNQDELTGNQVKNDPEEPKPSALEKVQPPDFMQVTKHEAVQLTHDGGTEKATGTKVEEQETHEEKDERRGDDPQKTEENAPMIVGSRDAGLKPAHKKSHILSGVGSKVKHSIAKMKMAITCNSAHHTAV